MRNIDKIVVVDLEATCWDGEPPAGERQEIIEIGVCLLDLQTRKIEGAQGLIIKPMSSRISPFCQSLTSITQSMVDEGMELSEACRRLVDHYGSRNRIWASYGYFDLNLLKKECEMKQIPYPMSFSHLNAKQIFALRHRLRKEIGMAKALNLAKLELLGTHHRGVDDAINIGRLLDKIL